MDIRPDFQIQVMIKAMEDVVIPAVEREHKMAVEQAGLVLSTLRVLQQRLPLWRRYVRDELRRFGTLAHEAGDVLPGGMDGIADLIAVSARARELLGDPEADTLELEQAAVACRNTIGKVMRAMSESGEKLEKTELGRIVLKASKVQLDRERAWLITSGFEDPSKITPIEQQLNSPIDSPPIEFGR